MTNVFSAFFGGLVSTLQNDFVLVLWLFPLVISCSLVFVNLFIRRV